MKKYILLLVTSICFSQTSYKFDYFLEYKFTNHLDTTKSEKVYYLTNSKDNSYYVLITKKDSLNFDMSFIKQDKFISKVSVSKKDLEKNKIININCKELKPASNAYKYQVKNYDYFKVKDSSNFETYKIASTLTEKIIEKKKIGYHILKFDINSPMHLPNLNDQTLYEEWKKERDLPNNFVTENSLYSFSNKLVFSEKLLNFNKIDKTIYILTTDCGELYQNLVLKLDDLD